jgi:hypothetical protein
MRLDQPVLAARNPGLLRDRANGLRICSDVYAGVFFEGSVKESTKSI